MHFFSLGCSSPYISSLAHVCGVGGRPKCVCVWRRGKAEKGFKARTIIAGLGGVGEAVEARFAKAGGALFAVRLRVGRAAAALVTLVARVPRQAAHAHYVTARGARDGRARVAMAGRGQP